MKIREIWLPIIIKLGQVVLSGRTKTWESDFFKVRSVEFDLIKSKAEFEQIKEILKRNYDIGSAWDNLNRVFVKIIRYLWNLVLDFKGICEGYGLLNLTVQKTLLTE